MCFKDQLCERSMKLCMALIVFMIMLPCCGPRHYHGCGFIHDPTFDLFGASLSHENSVYTIKSYIRSEITFRTEYIYENFDITFPDSFLSGKKYSVKETGVVIWYAKGGQVGQIETTKAEGTFIIKNKTERAITLELNIIFFDFKTTGRMLPPPHGIERKGVLIAEKGFRLY